MNLKLYFILFSLVSSLNFNLTKSIPHNDEDSDEDEDGERNNNNSNNNGVQSRRGEEKGLDWFVCNVCKKVFRAKKALFLHKKSEHPQQQRQQSSHNNQTRIAQMRDETSSLYPSPSSLPSTNYK